jgi:hypothetical protein
MNRNRFLKATARRADVLWKYVKPNPDADAWRSINPAFCKNPGEIHVKDKPLTK